MEQRKLVTVLFCDLVGSTELAGVLEPETLRSVVLRYFDMARQEIKAHGGTVEKFIGDAVMAVFGVPVVHEDDARRAATAALDMIASLAELNAELETSVGCRLAVRIGVNTGEVVTTTEEGANQNLIAGEVVNVAARLEQHAGAGEILIGPVTRALLGGSAVVEEVGELSLKGKRDPVTAFRLLGIRPDTQHEAESPFVGRERELALLDAAFARPDGQPVTVSGEAGIGKTRLLREWLSAKEDALIGTGRCHPYCDRASLMPLAHALRRILDAAASFGLLTEELVSEPSYGVLRSGLLLDGAPGHSASSTYAAIAAVLARLAAARPVVLVLDDMHWAEPMLIDGITQIANAQRAHRVLLVCSGRPDHARTLPGRAVNLTPLSEVDATRLAAGLVELQSHGQPTLARVIDRAEGNPLYLEQLVAMLDDGADLEQQLPVTVTAVLAARIDALRPDERMFLDAAAVVGREFDVRTVEALAESGAVAALAELTRRGLVEPVSGQTYRFRSGLLREVTYQGISKRRRAQWHEELAPGSAGHHLEQAYLYRQGLGIRDDHTAALRGKAARALTEAARNAMARADLSWSENLGKRAIAYSTKDDPWWTEAAQGLGETWLAVGRTAEGSELLRDVMATAAATGDNLAYAHARLQVDSHSQTGWWFPAADTAREALPEFEAAGDQLGLARGYVRLAQEQQFLGSHRTAEQLLEQALRHAEAANAAPEHAMALGALGISLWHGPIPAADAVRRCRQLLATREHDVAIVTLNYPLANLLALQGLEDEARACLATADRFATGLGFAEAAVLAPLFAAGVEALAGRLPAAQRLLREAVQLCRAAGDPRLVATASRDLARVLLRQGVCPEPELLGPADASGLPPEQAADHLGAHARTEAAKGNAAMALSLAERAVAESLATDSPITRAITQLDLAIACRAAGHRATARNAAVRAVTWFDGKGHSVGARTATEFMDAL
ncbi:adenylate/guanylate cyclase domain-containing protein [Kibdelosporangium aridum]|uniref:Adenylate/guanylate cyclase domain-containing protein n=1 Tax=Kibdelosporangium aridum TaxID=2030 RepID=A0A428Z106_KIBAR|nr:adenylate/guanylate cyclase domain-containing protein [Kibdelosporangium aridum]RSM78150.1 adenylate/guanylate cyclase domain-containing protein [Kibdelosporangium aridum]